MLFSVLGALNEQSAVRTLQLGEVRLTYVVDGAMGLTPAGFFPDIPAEHWADHPELLDANGFVPLSAGGLLVERDNRRLLIDTGMGPYTGEVSLGQTYVGPVNCGALPEVLAELGHAPSDIDTVAFTHLHIDHTGWAFGPDGHKFFPNARYLVAAQEWAPHGRGEIIPGAPPRPTVIEPMAGTHTRITDGEEIFPGVHALVTPGHSPGHTSYIISTSSGRIIVFGDGFHIPAQLTHPDWPSKPDVDRTAVRTARNRLITELEQPQTIGFAFHFGDQAFGRVVRDQDGLAGWEPVPATALLPTPRRLP
ncbi:MBL fold metallo-hydrolase [Nocardia sp. CA-128927]|uniref:MBL fold metallo-hydrolase n=1 Tax=Nocardia sp. CA-128927 TaxID=3239975 RepID=UPI003D9690AA